MYLRNPSQVDHGVSRRKVTPDLTVEFVNHFNGEKTAELLLKHASTCTLCADDVCTCLCLSLSLFTTTVH